MWKPMVAAALLAMMGGCTERRAAQALEPVTIEVAMLPHFSLVLVAHSKGYFKEEGLAVTLRPHPFGKVALDALLAGQGDLATSAETPAVLAELGGKPLSILASIGLSRRNMAVVARRDTGVGRPGDLGGKRIGVSLGTSGAFFLDTFLLRHQVDRQGVRLVDLRPDDMAAALAADRVDAVATWNPTALLLQRRFGERVQSYVEDELYSEILLLIGRRGFDRQRPEVSTRLLRALLKAEALFQDRPEEARRVAAAALGEDPASLDAVLRQFDFNVRLDQGLLVLMEEQALWAIRSGLAPPQAVPDFLASLAAGPLIALRPGNVGLIR
jgi:NitT/TauT family transport system substrate-binding protein